LFFDKPARLRIVMLFKVTKRIGDGDSMKRLFNNLWLVRGEIVRIIDNWLSGFRIAAICSLFSLGLFRKGEL